MSLPARFHLFDGQGQAGNWADAANWQDGNVPTATSNEIVVTSTAITGTVTAETLMFLGQESVTVSGTINTQSSAACTSFMVCALADATFTSTSRLNDSGGMVVGAQSTGVLNAFGNTTQHAVLNTLGSKLGETAIGHGTANIDGAVWNDSGNLFVGYRGTGNLSVTDVGQVHIGTNLVVAYLAGSAGSAWIASGSQVTVGGFTDIGDGNPAQLGGAATVLVQSGGLLAAAGPLAIAPGCALNLQNGLVNVADVTSGLTVSAGASLAGHGIVAALAGGIHDRGTITASGGTLVLKGALTGTGQLNISAASIAQISASTIGNLAIAFTGAGATLELDHGVTSQAVITGFNAGDTIVMQGVDQLDWNSAKDVLTLSSTGHVVDTLQFAGNYAGNPFTLTETAIGAVIGVASQQTALHTGT